MKEKKLILFLKKNEVVINENNKMVISGTY